jgi:hypothetical protein
MAAAQICAKECSQGLIRQTMSAAQWAVPTWVPAEEFRSSDYKWDLFSPNPTACRGYGDAVGRNS